MVDEVRTPFSRHFDPLRLLRGVGHFVGVLLVMFPESIVRRLGLPISLAVGAAMTYGAIPYATNKQVNIRKLLAKNQRLRGTVDELLPDADERAASARSHSHNDDLLPQKKASHAAVNLYRDARLFSVAEKTYASAGTTLIIAPMFYILNELIGKKELPKEADEDTEYGLLGLALFCIAVSTVAQLWESQAKGKLHDNTTNFQALEDELRRRMTEAEKDSAVTFMQLVNEMASEPDAALQREEDRTVRQKLINRREAIERNHIDGNLILEEKSSVLTLELEELQQEHDKLVGALQAQLDDKLAVDDGALASQRQEILAQIERSQQIFSARKAEKVSDLERIMRQIEQNTEDSVASIQRIDEFMTKASQAARMMSARVVLSDEAGYTTDELVREQLRGMHWSRDDANAASVRRRTVRLSDEASDTTNESGDEGEDERSHLNPGGRLS